MKTVIEELREHTSDLHDALESTEFSQLLMSSNLQLENYVQMLHAWALAWTKLEKVLTSSRWHLDIEHLAPMPRAHLAQQDLMYLHDNHGVMPPTPASSQPIHKVFPPEPSNMGELLGQCYVMRGSVLGGQVIAKHLHGVLGLQGGSGASFFSTQENQDLSWSQWKQSFCERVSATGGYDSALKGARVTFQYLLDNFRATGQKLVLV